MVVTMLCATHCNRVHDFRLHFGLEILQPRLRALVLPVGVPYGIEFLGQTSHDSVPVPGSHVALQIHHWSTHYHLLDKVRIRIMRFQTRSRVSPLPLVADVTPHADLEQHDPKTVHVE